MKRLNTAGSAIVLTAIFLVACGEKAEAPMPEQQAAEVETSVMVETEGSLSTAVVVETSTPESTAAFIATTAVQTLTATVVSIDMDTREVVLVGEEGAEMALIVREDARNLDQVSPGDTVNAQFVESVTIELVKGQDLKALNMSADRQVQAEEGAMPARAEIQKSIDIYTVEAIDLEANTFVLKDVEGEIAEFTARDPANLAKASVGDAVVVTTTEAMAVEVVKAAAE